MYLIVGLGNPEKKYEKTFHNMGFIAAGDAAEKLDVKFKKKECEASVAEAFIGGEKVIIARPVTYMNNSGRAVKQLAAKYKVPPEHVAVIYDDYDLPKGKIRIRPEGSAGTHNGMRSVIGETGWTNFPRIKDRHPRRGGEYPHHRLRAFGNPQGRLRAVCGGVRQGGGRGDCVCGRYEDRGRDE